MQKHYKLITGLLVCIFGTGLEGTDSAAPVSTSDAMARLRVAARDCAIPPQDLSTQFLSSEAHQDPLERISSAQRRVMLHAVKNMCEQIGRVAALPSKANYAQELELAVRTADACQAAEGFGVGSIAGPLKLKDARKFHNFLGGRKVQLISIPEIFNLEYSKFRYYIRKFDYNLLSSKPPLESDCCFIWSHKINSTIIFKYTQGEWMLSDKMYYARESAKEIIEIEQLFAQKKEIGDVLFDQDPNDVQYLDRLVLDKDNKVYLSIPEPILVNDNNEYKFGAISLPHLRVTGFNKDLRTCEIVFEANPQ